MELLFCDYIDCEEVPTTNTKGPNYCKSHIQLKPVNINQCKFCDVNLSSHVDRSGCDCNKMWGHSDRCYESKIIQCCENCMWFETKPKCYNFKDLYFYFNEDLSLKQCYTNSNVLCEKKDIMIFNEIELNWETLIKLCDNKIGKVGTIINIYENQIRKKARKEWTKHRQITRHNTYKNICENILLKIKLMEQKFTYGKYNGKYIIDVYFVKKSYIHFLLANNFELDCNKDYKQKILKKKVKLESSMSLIFRYLMGLPKFPCMFCKNAATYADNGWPNKCHIHKNKSDKLVKQSDKCIGVNKLCPYELKGNIKYDNYCTYCFSNLFPFDVRVKEIRQKSKEIEVVNYVCLTFSNIKWYHDKPLYINFDICCPSKRRIDLRALIRNTMLCIEVDENQHKYYTTESEFVRYNEIIYDLTCKYIFIRFNPDIYRTNNIIQKTNIKTRLNILGSEVIKQMQNINEGKNEELLEIIHLFYDS